MVPDWWDGQQGMTPMIDNTPYIIVDNQKISPIERSPQTNSATADRHLREDQTFGVIDRVTISSEARERSRQQHATTDAVSADIYDAAGKTSTSTHLLTYSPKRLRS